MLFFHFRNNFVLLVNFVLLWFYLIVAFFQICLKFDDFVRQFSDLLRTFNFGIIFNLYLHCAFLISNAWTFHFTSISANFTFQSFNRLFVFLKLFFVESAIFFQFVHFLLFLTFFRFLFPLCFASFVRFD